MDHYVRVIQHASFHVQPERAPLLGGQGVVLTLFHNGYLIRDSSVICEYLDGIFPQPVLRPDNPVECAGARTWMRYIEDEPTVAVRIKHRTSDFMADLCEHKSRSNHQEDEEQPGNDVAPAITDHFFFDVF